MFIYVYICLYTFIYVYICLYMVIYGYICLYMFIYVYIICCFFVYLSYIFKICWFLKNCYIHKLTTLKYFQYSDF